MKNTIISSLAAITTLAFVSCENPADSSTKANVSDPKKVEEGAASTGKKWVFADGSKIEFVGSKVTGSHAGGFNTFDGYFHMKDGTLDTSGHKVTIDMNSVFSDNEKLTGHLKSADFFDVEKFPEATFVATGLEEKAGEKGETHVLTGNFNLHGVEKSIDIPVKVTMSDEEVAVLADFFIDRYDFKIEYPGKPDDLIRKEVVIKLDLKAKPE